MSRLASPVEDVGPLRIVHVYERYRTYMRPYRVRIRQQDGVEFQACVKPQLLAASDRIEHLLAEWCGYVVAQHLKLPVPRAFLVELDDSFIRSRGSEASDVAPGPAIATEWMSDLHCGIFRPRSTLIRNRATVAGATVLDTIQQNNDREDDVLLVPVAGTNRYDLYYIDNTWLVWFDEGDPSRIQGRLPRNAFLSDLFHDGRDVPAYALDAASLDQDDLAVQIALAPAPFIAAAPASIEEIARVAAWRGRYAADAIARAVNQKFGLSGTTGSAS